MKVQQFYNKNQFVITDGATIAFQSYDSTIAQIKNGVLVLGEDWDYSKTTLKHLYLFLTDYRNNIDGYQYGQIFHHAGGLEMSKNKRQFLQNLIDKKTIKVTL